MAAHHCHCIVSHIGDAALRYQTSSTAISWPAPGAPPSADGLELRNAVPNSIRATTAVAGNRARNLRPLNATKYLNPPFTGLGGSVFEVIDGAQ